MFPRRALYAVIGMFCLGTAATFADAATSGNRHYIQVRLHPVRGSGFASGLGYGVLESAGNKTGVNVSVARLPSGVVVPAHLYTYLVEGRCESRTARRAYPLDRVTTQLWPALGSGMTEVQGRVPLAFDQLRRRDYALSVRLSPADGGQEFLCGNVS